MIKAVMFDMGGTLEDLYSDEKNDRATAYALHDILTGLPHRGSHFVLMLPEEDAPVEVRLYAERIRRVFQDSEEENAE